MLQVQWGNRMEMLADAMFAHLDDDVMTANPTEVFARRDCIVVPNRLVKHWLLHRFVFRDRDETVPRVLADVDFPLLNIFVNDGLGRIDRPGLQTRDPLEHPFSTAALQWRIYQLLSTDAVPDPVFTPVYDYIRSGAPGNPAAAEKRGFVIAGRLATLFDEYMVYRPAMLKRWEGGEDGTLDENLRWQPALWRRLTAGALRDQTYLAAFFRMDGGLPRSGIQAHYRVVHVFGVSMMPAVFIRFFEILAESLPVRLYALNPCRRDWFDDRSVRDSLLEGRLDPEPLLGAGNTFLSEHGRGCRDFLAELLDRTHGQAEAGSLFVPPSTATVLGRLQADLLEGGEDGGAEGGDWRTADASGTRVTAAGGGDGSVMLHICHNPMREMEVLHDHLLRWFAEDPQLQPREVQVQVSDMAAFAPLIDAVFAEPGRSDPAAIPYVIADRLTVGENPEGDAFRRLLDLADSRFSAPEVMDLLQCESVRAAFALGGDDCAALRRWVDKAGIRWGHDAAHRRQVLGTAYDPPAATTWRYGLDRLLLGCATGSRFPPVSGTDTSVPPSVPLPCDQVEDGQDAVTLGRFAAFYDQLCRFAAWCRVAHAPGEWADRIDAWITAGFAVNDENYRAIGALRKAVAALRKSAAAAEMRERIGLDGIRQFLTAQIAGAAGGGDRVQNAVVFSALRPGGSMPRRIVCLLGMSDGLFPRRENRAHYDLFRTGRRLGDRSQRGEDRMAFLEAVLSARDRLYVSYSGISVRDGRETPAAVPVEALREHLARREGGEAMGICRHRLQAHHPSYFDGGSALFSCSREARLAAQAQARVAMTPPEPDAAGSVLTVPATPAPAAPVMLDLDEIEECLRNPARYYYIRVLNVRLEVDPAVVLADSEEFDPEGRIGYVVNQRLVEALLESPPLPPAQILRRLEEDGLLPLMHAGAHWFKRRLTQVQALLESPVPGMEGCLAEIVNRSRLARPQPLSAALDPFLIAGSGRHFQAAGSAAAPLALDVRWGRPRAVDRLTAWLHHLFACAAGVSETRVYVAGRPDVPQASETVCFAPLDQAAATAWLRPMAEACLAARARILPFTPETSWAYVQAIRKGDTEDEDAAEAHARGMAAARKAWEPQTFGGGDMQDIYLRRAFGYEGPFAQRGEFAALAGKLAGPLADAL